MDVRISTAFFNMDDKTLIELIKDGKLELVCNALSLDLELLERPIYKD